MRAQGHDKEDDRNRLACTIYLPLSFPLHERGPHPSSAVTPLQDPCPFQLYPRFLSGPLLGSSGVPCTSATTYAGPNPPLFSRATSMSRSRIPRHCPAVLFIPMPISPTAARPTRVSANEPCSLLQQFLLDDWVELFYMVSSSRAVSSPLSISSLSCIRGTCFGFGGGGGAKDEAGAMRRRNRERHVHAQLNINHVKTHNKSSLSKCSCIGGARGGRE